MNKLIRSFLLLLCATNTYAQATDSLKQELNEIQVRAFGLDNRLQNIPAAISHIGSGTLHRSANTNILQAINTAPGIRMEERSPGSYRLSIRGSSLRAPFGVRNVKIYYNDIPFTDPGGHTYLNQLGLYNFQSVEIIKGPASSLYGAGTGGVMLISSTPEDFREGATLSYTGGSYGLQQLLGELRFGSRDFQNTVRYQHLQADGYREQSQMRRDVLSWDAHTRLNGANELNVHFLYGDLFYETPGALTLEEYETDPRQARPPVPIAPGVSIPGSSEMKAAVYEQTFLAGISLKHSFTPKLQNTTTVYGAYSGLLNPTIRNYGRSSEPHTGGRTTFKYRGGIGNTKLDWLIGGELQQGFTSVRIYGNIAGTPDTLQTDDELHIRQYFAFLQLTWQFDRLMLTGGLSLNRQRVAFTRFSNPPATEYTRDFDNELAPRIAALYRVSPEVSLYATLSKGFSPPTSAELSPGGGSLNASLNAEEGWNYEAGARGRISDSRLYFDISAFHLNLSNTIVQRRDSLSGDYFLNAGATRQAGIETYLNYKLHALPASRVAGNIWASYTWYNFSYDGFIQAGQDYSGNRLPSVAPHTIAAGIDLQVRAGLYAHLGYYYSDKIALDDANSAFADPYHLIGLKIGFRKEFKNRYGVDVFAGGDNLLDQTYSLGNDINGFGGRFYNAAAGRNFYAGFSLTYNRDKP